MMATSLIALLLLTPIVKAGVVHFWWDNVYFIQGTDIDYPHPNNVYYDISKTTDWTKLGYALYHCQINKDSTFQIIVGSVALSAALGLAVTVWLGGGTMAALVGGLTGIVLASLVQIVIDYYFVDERGCIWFWVSVLFVDWLMENLSWLYPLCVINPALGYSQILIGFLTYGEYLRVGKVTFHDGLGIGSNYPPWDINEDGKCDIQDVAIVAKAYGSYVGHPRWNPDADINGSEYLVPDGKVDMRDVALVSKYYGERY